MTQSIVFLDIGALGPNVVLRKPDIDHTWQEHVSTTYAERLERLAGASIVITNKVKLDALLLEHLPNLKMIAIAATGTNVVDLKAAGAQNIVVSNIVSYATSSVPEHVFMLILALKRSLLGYLQDLGKGEWEARNEFCFFTHPIHDLAGCRLGIIGRGELGCAVGALAQAFGMEVVYAGRKGVERPPAPYLAFDEVLATADVISVHCPLTAETQNLIAISEFKQMKKRPIIINTARGGIVNEEGLVAALKNEWVSGAGMDVVSSEPPGSEHPFYELLGAPNFILTPHIGWGSNEARQILADQLIDNVENFVKGQPSNVCRE